MNHLIAPRIGWALMLIGIYIASQTLLSMPFVLWNAFTSRTLVLNLPVLGVVMGAGFIGTLWMAVLLCKRPWRELVSWTWPPAVLIPATVVLALGTCILCSEIHNRTLALIPMPEFVAQIFNLIFDVKGNPLGATLALVVVAPVCEEFICRRWLLESLLQRFRPGLSIVISAVVFGLMHLNPWQFFYATVLGLTIGWLYWRARSVSLCILWHALNNGVVVMAAYWTPNIPGFRKPEPGVVEFQPAWLNLIGFGLLLAGGALAWWQTRRMVVERLDYRLPPPPLPLPAQ